MAGCSVIPIVNFFKKIFLAFTSKERVAFWTIILALLISGTVLLGIIFQKTTKVVPAEGGEYTEGMVGQPTHINPVLGASDADKTLVRIMFADLVSLSEKIESERDDRTWRVRLQEGLTWSDGHALTSDDVIFTIQKIQNPETQSPFFVSWQGIAVNRLSELEIQFNLVSSYPLFRENLTGLFPVPKHIFADTPSANWRLSEYNLKPVGSGAYKFKSFEKQANGFITGYRFERNPNYAGQEALIGDLALRFFVKQGEMLRAFNAGEIDGLASLDPEFISQINRPYQATVFRLPNYYAVFLNQSQNLALKDKSVRNALAWSVDRPALVNDVFGGRAVTVDGPVPPALIGGETATAADPSAAATALDTDGWKVGENGIREKGVKANKIELGFTLTVPQVGFLEKTAQILQARWAAIGIKTEIRTVPAEEIMGGAIRNRDYQALLFGNVLNPPADLYSFWHSNERFFPGLNLSLYSNKNADRLIESTRREADPIKREVGLRELNRIIYEDYPAVFLYSPDYTMISNKELRGITSAFILDASDRLRQASVWHLRTTRAIK